MSLPAGLDAVRYNRPLFADYMLGWTAYCWGAHAFIWPLSHDVSSYRWLSFPTVMALVAVIIGLWQIGAALALHVPMRRVGALLGAALFLNFAINIFGMTKQAPGSSVDFGVGSGDLILFFWPYL